jgi:hypothetical protein
MRHAACTWERGSDMGLAERAARAPTAPESRQSQPRNSQPNTHARHPAWTMFVHLPLPWGMRMYHLTVSVQQHMGIAARGSTVHECG